jgi:thiol-disulfide isomerase/thioredoxin
MNRSQKQIYTVFFVTVFLAFHFYIKYQTQPVERQFQGAKKGEEVESFQGTTIDEQKIDLAAAAKEHKVLILNFWETWCGPCRVEMPDLQKMYLEYKDQGLGIIAVYESSHIDDVKKMIDENSLTFQIMHDPTRAISKKFKVQYLPTTVVVDQNLKVLRSYEGIDAGLHAFIGKQLKGNN